MHCLTTCTLSSMPMDRCLHWEAATRMMSAAQRKATPRG
jgi:hypothetical protein